MRKLRTEERNLVQLLLDQSEYSFEIEDIDVIDMKDGNMGSITFLSEDLLDDRCMAKTIAEMSFKDEDSTLISVSLNIDCKGYLFELDIWKVDFTEVKKYPSLRTLV